jgi:hypothetical protein
LNYILKHGRYFFKYSSPPLLETAKKRLRAATQSPGLNPGWNARVKMCPFSRYTLLGSPVKSQPQTERRCTGKIPFFFLSAKGSLTTTL